MALPWGMRIRQALLASFWAGLQAAGPSITSICVMLLVWRHGRPSESVFLPYWFLAMGLFALAASVLGFPSRPRGPVAVLGRLLGTGAFGGAVVVGWVVGMARFGMKPDDVPHATAFAFLGVALLALGVLGAWRGRRQAEAEHGSPTAGAWLAAAGVLALGLVVPWLAVPAWVAGFPSAVRAAPATIGAPMGLALGLAASALVVVWRRRSAGLAGALAAAVLPGVVAVAGVVACGRALLVRSPGGVQDAAATSFIDDAAAAMLDQLTSASLLVAGSLLLGGIVAAGASLAVALRGGPELDEHAGVGAARAPRRGSLPAAFVGLAGLVAALALTSRHVEQGAWLAAVPSAAGIAGVCLAAPADAIAVSLLGIAGTFLLAWAAAVGAAPVDALAVAPLSAALPGIAALPGGLLEAALPARAFAAPVLLALAARAASVRFRGLLSASTMPGALAIALVAAPIQMVRGGAESACAGASTLWTRHLPADVTLPTVYLYSSNDCVDLDPSALLTVGARVRVGDRELGPASLLDRDEGCAQVALAIDRGIPAGHRLRVAVDAATGGGRLECLLRALASPVSADTSTGRTAHRRARCELDWVAGVVGGEAYPRCVAGALAGDECPRAVAGQRQLAVLSATDVRVWRYALDRIDVTPIPAAAPLDRFPWPALEQNDQTWVAVVPDARAAQLVALLAAQSPSPSQPIVALPFVPSSEPGSFPEPPALPVDDPLLRVRGWAYADRQDGRRVSSSGAGSSGERFARCAMLVPHLLDPADERHGRVSALVARADTPIGPPRLWPLDATTDAQATACILATVSAAPRELVGPPGLAAVHADVTVGRASMEVGAIDFPEGVRVARPTLAALQTAVKSRLPAMLSTCFAPALRQHPNLQGGIVLDVRARGLVVTGAVPVEPSDVGFERCVARALVGTRLDAPAEPGREPLPPRLMVTLRAWAP